ncbi:MAG: metallophosphoesterase [Deltaproteobacteria bacterium]|nr:metallophosphoesterase [Deltaproteobacteria bacterium]
MNRIKLVISDCHLSAGLNFESRKNPHEDFFFDDEMVAFFEYFSSGKYGEGREVELVINGDFLDFLNVPYRGEFEEVITEQFALYKLECILAGHPKVIRGLRRFASLPGKTITYNIGNHDADLFFPKVRERLVQALDPDGQFPSAKVRLNHVTTVIDLGGGVQVQHGNQYEAVHVFNYEKPLLTEGLKEPVLNIPWGSFYVLKIVNRLKWERDYVDKVRPIRAMILWGLLFDTWFILRFAFLSLLYFMKTRFIYSPQRRSRLKVTLQIFQQETMTFLQDLEAEARRLLEEQPDVHTVIMGHTHLPMFKSYPDGKVYINTGTWTKMIHLDLRGMGNHYRLTFAFVEFDAQGKGTATLQQWIGEHKPHVRFDG